MSKRVQTTNLNLYAYENLRGLPTFLKDWSDNMLILDGAYVTVNGLISALDTRLTTAEGTLEDLSPESIEDYKIRLDALEKKVVINTNAIKDVNTRIGTINAQINSINVEQGVQNSRLTALEGVTANHTTQINSMIGDISSVTGRVTTLEQCCETVQHEIADMQSDIDGFNDDLTVLATQFETVSGVVSELTDLVNSLQLDVVSQRLDTFESDLNALTASVTSLGGRMTDAENQIELNGNAINENALDIASIESEMGNTDYSEVGDTVSSAIVELADRIRNLTPQEYDTLVQAIQDAEQEIDDIQALIPDDATSSNKLITLNDIVIPSVNIASASRAGIVKVGQRLSVQSDGTLDADNQIGDSSYGLVKSVNDNASAISGLEGVVGDSSSGLVKNVGDISNSLTVVDPNDGSGLIGFGVDANGNYGYKKVGADTVTPFKTGGNCNFLWGKYSTNGSTMTLFNQLEVSMKNLYFTIKVLGLSDFQGYIRKYENESWVTVLANGTDVTCEEFKNLLNPLVDGIKFDFIKTSASYIRVRIKLLNECNGVFFPSTTSNTPNAVPLVQNIPKNSYMKYISFNCVNDFSLSPVDVYENSNSFPNCVNIFYW